MVVEDDKRYMRITIKTNCGGVFVRDEVLGKDIKTKKQYYVKAGQLSKAIAKTSWTFQLGCVLTVSLKNFNAVGRIELA